MIDIDVNFDAFQEMIETVLDEFDDELTAEADRIFKESAAELRDLLVETSPYDDDNKTGRHYKDGWTVSVEKFGNDKIYIIHNKTKPGLTHLLEYGWVSEKTGEIVGRYPRINKSYTEIQEKIFEKLINLL